MSFGAPIEIGTSAVAFDLVPKGQPISVTSPDAAMAAITNLTQSLREKDDIIQAQYAELTEARRQIGLLREAVEHWKAKAQA